MPRLLISLVLALSVPIGVVSAPVSSLASETVDEEATRRAEVERLTTTMRRLAAKNAWAGVERTWAEIRALEPEPGAPLLLLAAQAASQRGDLVSVVKRLAEAQAIADTEDVGARLLDLTTAFGPVQLTGLAGSTLEAGQGAFRPDAIAAFELARKGMAEEGHYQGFLPVGSYTLDGEPFEVVAGTYVVIGSDGSLPRDFPKKTLVAGGRLIRNGVGERLRFGLPVYVAALYLKARTEEAMPAIRQDLPKQLVLRFHFGRISRRTAVDHFRKGIEGTLAVRGVADDDVETFLAAFDRDLVSGDTVEFTYIPGVGTAITLSGKRQALIEGKPFMWALWELFLGDSPPTEELKAGLLGGE